VEEEYTTRRMRMRASQHTPTLATLSVCDSAAVTSNTLATHKQHCQHAPTL